MKSSSIAIASLAWAGAVFASPLHARAGALCEDIEYIIGDYGTLKGSLGGANIIIPGLSGREAGKVVREFLAFLDPANANVYELYESIPGCVATGVAEDKPPTAATCAALPKVIADVAQTVTLMSNLANAKDLPDRLEIDGLQEVTDDASVRIVSVQTTLKALGCTV
ncbi:hypothetical protein QBC34DRAFT_475933 [Podospora aff. communis PSN243]|uniref:Uncharacterized protein n=1 Tax=Podospora aff. communis PSN243 TaxID=3040156 RepID=A0AAV9G9D2_9PEZI|nr:hypothetical protein QBC34DRAFT_475933 [Podospora aff. communis PSN243]